MTLRQVHQQDHSARGHGPCNACMHDVLDLSARGRSLTCTYIFYVRPDARPHSTTSLDMIPPSLAHPRSRWQTTCHGRLDLHGPDSVRHILWCRHFTELGQLVLLAWAGGSPHPSCCQGFLHAAPLPALQQHPSCVTALGSILKRSDASPQTFTAHNPAQQVGTPRAPSGPKLLPKARRRRRRLA